MLKLQLPTGWITVHESARTLPETRRVEMEAYQMIDTGIGSTLADFDAHFDRMSALAAGEAFEELPNAINNMRYLFFDILNKQISPRALSFACLVEEVNGEKWTDYSEPGLERLVMKLSDLSLSDELVQQHGTELKKKIYEELGDAFPKHFGDLNGRSVDLLRDSLLVALDEELTPEDPALPLRAKRVRAEIARAAKPPVFDPDSPDNVLAAMRKAHRQRKVLMMTEHLPINDLTPAYEFWEYVVTLQERYEASRQPRPNNQAGF